MKLSVRQALSFVAATSKGAPKIVLDAWLGNGRTPKDKDFGTDDPDRRENAEDYLDVLQSVLDTLVEHLRNLPRQTSMFDARARTTTSNAIAVTEKKIIVAKPGAKVKDAKKKKKNDTKKKSAVKKKERSYGLPKLKKSAAKKKPK